MKKTNPKKKSLSQDQTRSTLPNQDFGPLCVDLDGTLISTDVTFESLRLWLVRSPFRVFKIPFMIMGGRARFKRELSKAVTLDVKKLPYNPLVLELLKKRKDQKERLVLVTAADKTMAVAVSEHLDLFDEVLGSDGTHNLRGQAKANKLISLYGEKSFSYMGNSKDDLAVWDKSLSGIGVGITPRVEDRIKRLGLPVRILSRRPSGFREFMGLLIQSPWSWACFIIVGALVKGLSSSSVSHSHLFLLFLLVGVMATMLARIVCYRAPHEHPTSSGSFSGDQFPLSIGFALLGLSGLGVFVLLFFTSLPGWGMGFVYGLVCYLGIRRGVTRFTDWGLGLLAFLTGLIL